MIFDDEVYKSINRNEMLLLRLDPRHAKCSPNYNFPVFPMDFVANLQFLLVHN